MVGAVLYQELRLGSRRHRLRAFRWAYAGWLVAQGFFFYLEVQQQEHARLLASWQAQGWGGEPVSFAWGSAPEAVGARFAETFVTQQLILLALATPALVAGAVTDEKRRGTLEGLLTAGL